MLRLRRFAKRALIVLLVPVLLITHLGYGLVIGAFSFSEALLDAWSDA